MNIASDTVYYDLSTPQGQQAYSAAVQKTATAWAENFEEPKQGDGEPYELGQGLDLWVDLVERWEEDFGDYAVSDIDVAERIGTPVCEEVIARLVSKRLDD